ncbi:MAG: hypothetical protein HC841_00415 [Verrucomicrobiae bacterium]|nr:hypothetical protein [Verrucomicrobiae bacterium]
MTTDSETVDTPMADDCPCPTLTEIPWSCALKLARGIASGDAFENPPEYARHAICVGLGVCDSWAPPTVGSEEASFPDEDLVARVEAAHAHATASPQTVSLDPATIALLMELVFRFFKRK